METNATTTDSYSYLVQVHASLMVVSWIGCVSVAITIARHYKQVWVGAALCGTNVWFALHRGLALTGLALMVVAQTSIFYYLGMEYRVGAHQLFGSLAFAIAVLQPVGAFLRPEPQHRRRRVFNWIHWLLGNAGHISACVAVFLATRLSLAALPPPFLWTMIVYVVFHVFTHIVLQFHAQFMQNRSFVRRDHNQTEIALHDVHQSLNETDREVGPVGDAPGSGFRRFVLGVYTVTVFTIVLALIAFISLPNYLLRKLAIV